MSWLIPSFVMFVSSALMYTLIRKGHTVGINNLEYSLAVFVQPTPMYIVYGLLTKSSFALSFWQFFLITFSAVFFAYLGNHFSMKSLRTAPNPGYSLIISKSYVVFTSIASVFLFGAPLSIKSIIAIVTIVGFSALIVLANKQKKHHTSSYLWLWQTMASFFCWSGLALMSKYLLNIGTSVAARVFYLSLIVSILLLIEAKHKKQRLTLDRKQIVLLGLISVSAMVFNTSMQIGYQLAPNPGFINAVNSGSIVLVTLLAAWLFGDELNTMKFIGVVGVTAGLVLLFV